jgi:hypothetical protein
MGNLTLTRAESAKKHTKATVIYRVCVFVYSLVCTAGLRQLRRGVGFLRHAQRAGQFPSVRDEQRGVFPAADGDPGGAVHAHGVAHHATTGSRRVAPHQQVAQIHSANAW